MDDFILTEELFEDVFHLPDDPISIAQALDLQWEDLEALLHSGWCEPSDIETVFALARALRVKETPAAMNYGQARSFLEPQPPVAAPAAAPPDDPPLSLAQQRLWFLDRLAPESGAYNLSTTIHIRGLLTASALAVCFREIVRRHEVLRTTFLEKDGHLVQVVHSPADVRLPVVDLAALPPSLRMRTATRVQTTESLRSFDLRQGPLLRIMLLRLATDEHTIVLTLHSAVADVGSVELILIELADLYRAAVNGTASPLSDLQYQFGDFARWQREMLVSDLATWQLEWWKAQLMPHGQLPEPLDLPMSQPRPAVQNLTGAHLRFTLQPNLTASVMDFSKSHSTDPIKVLLAGFALLLRRYTGRNDIVIGLPISSRTVKTARLVGPFVNTLAIRLEVPSRITFEGLFRRVRRAHEEVCGHHTIPFEKLVDVVASHRDLSREPVFQVVFAERPSLPQIDLNGLRARVQQLDIPAAKADLTLTVWKENGGLVCSWNYAAALFDERTLALACGHLTSLLSGALANPATAVADLPMVTMAERKQIVSWNDTSCPFPSHICTHHLVIAQSHRTPDAVALSSDDCTVTYAELRARAETLATGLVARGVGPEKRVGVCVEPSPEMVIAQLAVLIAGGAYVPIDPSHPPERLSFMLTDAGAEMVVTRAPLRRYLEALSSPFVLVDLDLDEASEQVQPLEIRPSNLAYVMYSSGSTGRPKGICLTHKGLVNLIAWHCSRYEVVPSDRASQVASPAFDASVWEIWPYLSVGACVCFPPGDDRRSAAALYRWLAKEHITLTFLPTPLAEVMLATEAASGFTLRALFVGGDLLHRRPPTLLPCPLINHYGPTEATVVTTAAEISPEGPLDDRPPPIGYPISNYRVYVVDSALQPLPVGVTGELVITGIGLARGYLGHPALTAERFVPNPFAVDCDETGTRVYRTGDIGRWRADGSIEFLGRLETPIKMRGFRVDLGEIESAIGNLPGVRHCVVLIIEISPENKQLVAFLVGSPPHQSQIRAKLAEWLPDYMVPSRFVTLETLPLNPNGKVDRRALAAMYFSALHTEVADSAILTPLQEVLVRIWAEVLGLNRVGISEDFFELGGHSLLAMKLVSRVRKELGVELPLRSIFETPTIAGLAVTVAAAESSSPDSGVSLGEAPGQASAKP